MSYYLVQPWGRDRYRQTTVQSIHATVDDAYSAARSLTLTVPTGAMPTRTSAGIPRQDAGNLS